ncbi:mechanosensitive ion channel family protein [Planctomycetes bacterium TBK1r]|uniref:Small-conductance mechanosensitive channel n=1 Tax=Stieleria magnilauensis TaxID=2527963 RepID=A0ABX5XWL6_9BACT|nr:Small-conductance mechanosensitive channel [Planctomycetes bacterium TBK1r]
MEHLKPLLKDATFDPNTWFGAIAYGIVFFLLAWATVRALNFVLGRRRERLVGTTSHGDVSFLYQLGRSTIYLVALVLYAHFIPAFRSIGTALLAGVSVASIVIGLAAQTTLSNLIAGVVLIIYRPFELEDRIQLSAPTGIETAYVKDITLGYTVLETADNRRIVVPNSLIASQITINLTRTEKRTQVALPFHLDAEASVESAREVLLDVTKTHPKVVEVSSCLATQVDGAGVTLTLKVLCDSSADAARVQSDVIEQTTRKFREQNISLAMPSSFTKS